MRGPGLRERSGTDFRARLDYAVVSGHRTGDPIPH